VDYISAFGYGNGNLHTLKTGTKRWNSLPLLTTYIILYGKAIVICLQDEVVKKVWKNNIEKA
jgi:hypothetical protein